VVPRDVRPRIGELLVEAGRLTPADLQRGLAAQKATRTRLGATLASMGIVTDDEVARSLARQHGVPAALEKHLAGRDPTLAAKLSPELARSLIALPIAMSRGGDGLNLVVCMRDPTASMVADLRAHVGAPIIASVAGERALRKAIDVAYPPPVVAPPSPTAPTAPATHEAHGEDESIDIDVDVETDSQPFPSIGVVDESALVELDDEYVNKDHTQASTPAGAAPVMEQLVGKQQSSTQTAVRIPDMRRTPPSMPAVKLMRLDEAIIALATAETGDDVVEIAVQSLRTQWKAALVMQVKDRERLALGQAGFGGGVTSANVESIVVPLDQPSVLRTAHDDRRPWSGDATISSTVQDRFLRLFAEVGSKTIAVAPVLVRARPVGLLFGLGPLGSLPEGSAALATLAHAMGEAYLRIILSNRD
jgi:hypothetical protein